MPLVAQATSAMILGPGDQQHQVLLLSDIGLDRPEEAGPPRTRVILPVALEQGQIAAGANESSPSLFMIEGTGSRAFGVFFAQHAVGGRRKSASPLRVAHLSPRGGFGVFVSCCR